MDKWLGLSDTDPALGVLVYDSCWVVVGCLARVSVWRLAWSDSRICAWRNTGCLTVQLDMMMDDDDDEFNQWTTLTGEKKMLLVN